MDIFLTIAVRFNETRGTVSLRLAKSRRDVPHVLGKFDLAADAIVHVSTGTVARTDAKAFWDAPASYNVKLATHDPVCRRGRTAQFNSTVLPDFRRQR